MTHTINKILKRYKRFEVWFDKKFGWFFTNGMKHNYRYDESNFNTNIVRFRKKAEGLKAPFSPNPRGFNPAKRSSKVS